MTKIYCTMVVSYFFRRSVVLLLLMYNKLCCVQRLIIFSTESEIYAISILYYVLLCNVSHDITWKKTAVYQRGGRTSDASPYQPIFVFYLPSFPKIYKLRNHCIYNSFGYDMTKCAALRVYLTPEIRVYIRMKYYC